MSLGKAAKRPQAVTHVHALDSLLLAAFKDPAILGPTAARGANSFEALSAIATAAVALAAQKGPEAALLHLAALNKALADVPDCRAWPAVRRVIVAALALRTHRHGPLSPAAESQAAQLLQRLYFAHILSAQRKGVVEFTHVSRSGGTTFCQLAQRNGCSTEDFRHKENCLIEAFDDAPRYVDLAVHNALRPPGVATRCDDMAKGVAPRAQEVSCGERRSALRRAGHSVYSNEYTAVGGAEHPAHAHHCGNMLTVLQVRHPHARVVSHIKHMWHAYSKRCKGDRDVYFEGGRDAETWGRLLPAAMNNYLIRSMLGEAAFRLPVGAITREHLELARVFLAQQMNVILVLEEARLSFHSLRYGLGWWDFLEHANSAPADTAEGVPASLELLWERNALDVELYDFAAVMAAGDAVVYDVAAAMAARAGVAPQDAPAWLVQQAVVAARAEKGGEAAHTGGEVAHTGGDELSEDDYDYGEDEKPGGDVA
ncbi:hypothetical protein HYH03_004985 [Edaphochlamys debaryana]|uniref:Uncharacterized protein n=1 Tax=Edaphochlamys debaryana TaxID=47281 RepID=A0A835Y8C1_9CHLO|nr:hypothetical protein HYH03_004985 [Edaphochlamys debaryana]|eukprot:KAG2496979.1 hypothetical protein HYH03_004985 [Edaphochlamys debaryana]